jgi:16S rRNA (cytidine1402-2'-O)-methyltransferase
MSGPSRGVLWLVPNTLDLGVEPDAPLDATLSRGVIAQAATLTHWVVENAKSARAFLKRIDALQPLAVPLQSIDIRELQRPPKDGRTGPARAEWEALLAPALAGHPIGLLSEAGLPAVADPGAALVAAAHRASIEVRPLPGPSALTLALAASGLHGQSFAFIGYLPTDAAQRAARVRELEARSRRENQTQIAIETPYRNAALAAALLQALAPTTRLAIASGLTLRDGSCRMRSVAEWRDDPPSFGERPLPAVFLWLST